MFERLEGIGLAIKPGTCWESGAQIPYVLASILSSYHGCRPPSTYGMYNDFESFSFRVSEAEHKHRPDSNPNERS